MLTRIHRPQPSRWTVRSRCFSALNASNLTFNSAQINWTTNKATVGQVQYDTGTGNFDFHFDYNGYATNHSLTIGPLGSNTAYRARILARDAAGNMATSPTLTFTTAKLHDLSVTADAIAFSDSGPASGDRITMSAKIHNGGDFSETATIVFYDSTPTDGNIEVGRTSVTVPAHAAADALAVSPSFVVLEGPHKPFVQIVNAAPAEDITSNNAAGTDLTVGAPACRFAFGVATPVTFPGDDSLFAVNITNTGSKPQTLSGVTAHGNRLGQPGLRNPHRAYPSRSVGSAHLPHDAADFAGGRRGQSGNSPDDGDGLVRHDVHAKIQYRSLLDSGDRARHHGARRH